MVKVAANDYTVILHFPNSRENPLVSSFVGAKNPEHAIEVAVRGCMERGMPDGFSVVAVYEGHLEDLTPRKFGHKERL